MNWLAKINLKIVFKRFGPFRSVLALVILIGLCLYVGYRFGNFYHSYQQKVLVSQQVRLKQLYAEQDKNIKQINTLEVELEIERIANQKSSAMLTKIEAAHYQVKKELAFYEKVMAPEKQAEGLVIDNLTLSATESKNHYRFQVVLVQQSKKKRYAKGYIRLTFSGSLNNQARQFSLKELSKNTHQQLSFNFKYFQVVEGEFTLPENYIPEKVAVSAILPKGKWQKYHRLDLSYPWKTEAAAKMFD